MRVNKLGRADIAVNLHPSMGQLGQQLLFLVDLVDHLLAAGKQLEKIYLRRLRGQPVTGPLLGIAGQASRFGQHPDQIITILMMHNSPFSNFN